VDILHAVARSRDLVFKWTGNIPLSGRAGASLRDVQLLAGHRSIDVTQGYIDGDTDAQRRLWQASELAPRSRSSAAPAAPRPLTTRRAL